MNKLIALCYFLLSLYGCDIGGSTLIHHTQTDGATALHSKVIERPGLARLECVQSASGQCHYTLFPRRCADRGVNCQAAPVKHFVLADGGSLQVVNLQRVDVCVSAEAEIFDPDCATPQAVSAR
ncbi:MAG: hypothetical protein M3414_00605 [Pseudomonadota bacterium]|nr:hypothetical protein [Pseudomonadota bacterium]